VKTVAIVGASLAGLSAARALRSQGFDGQLVIIGDETHRPYDRPPLSKEFLAGIATEADLALEADDEDLGAQWRLGVRATALCPASRGIELSDGSTLVADGVVLATGATPRTLEAVRTLRGVHTLRNLDEARALRAELKPNVRLVVVGAGFIGAEVASTARGLGVHVTVVEAAPAPLAGPLGPVMGSVVSGLHSANGVDLRCGVAVAGLAGSDRVTGVELTDGTTVPADVVVLGVGVRPAIDWLASSGLDLDNGVRCDAFGATGIDGVVAVGDCATWYEPTLGRQHRLEHWTAARERSAIAVATLLSGGTEQRTGRPPYFWSDQYGVRIQFAGFSTGFDEVTVEEGSLTDHDFLAVYRRQSRPIGVLALGHVKSFTRWRRLFAQQTTVSAVQGE